MGRPRIIPTETKPCDLCGGPIPIRSTDSPATYKTRKTCGPACLKAIQSNMHRGQTAWNKQEPLPSVACEQCGEMFLPQYRGNPNRFCSLSCRSKHTSARYRNPMTKHCARCGKKFVGPTARIETRTYCSKRCADQARTVVTGEDHPLFKPKVVMTCTVCGKVCEVKPSLESRFRACSRRCASTLAKLTYPRTSSLEQAIADALTELGEPFVPQKQFQYYVVDFWLPAYNAVIECDGAYWHALPKQVRIDKAKDSYFRNRDIPLIRLTEQEIKASAMGAIQRALHLLKPPQAA